MKRLAIVGIAIILAGLVLAVGYWPLTTVSGPQLLAAEKGSTYVGYAVGARITIHGTAESVGNASLPTPNSTVLYLASGDHVNPIPIYVNGDANAVVTPNEIVYMPAVLARTASGQEYWTVANPSDIRPAWPVVAACYAAMGFGVALVFAAAYRANRRTPET